MTHEQGTFTEFFAADALRKHGIETEIVDTWFDIETECKKHKIEIKSTHLLTKRGRLKKKNQVSQCAGQFHFVDDYNRDMQRQENVWYGFVLMHKTQAIILGFKRAKDIPDKKYVGWPTIAKMNPISLYDFAENILAERKTDDIQQIREKHTMP